MSFWEDRFVNRPSTSVPPGAETDAHAPEFTETHEPDVREAFAPAPDFSGERAELEFDEVIVEPLEEDGPRVSEVDDVLVEAEADAQAHEYRRSGLFRRRKLVPVQGVLDDDVEEAAQAESELEDVDPSEAGSYAAGFNGNGNGNEHGHGYSWGGAPEHVEDPESEVVEIEEGYAEAAEEDELDGDQAAALESPEVEYRRRGLFRRRKPVPIEDAPDAVAGHVEVEPASEDEHDAHPGTHAEYLVEYPTGTTELRENGAAYGWSNSWSQTTEPDEDPYVADAAEAVEIEEIPAQEDQRPEHQRKGLSRRRKSVPIANDLEDEVDSEVEHDEASFDPAFEAPEDERDDDLAAAVELPMVDTEDAPAVEYRRRGLFRRRTPVPVAPELEDAFEDGDEYEVGESVEAESVEGDAFDNVPFYANESVDDDNEQVDQPQPDADVAETEFEEADMLSMSGTEETEGDAVVEPELPSEEPAEADYAEITLDSESVDEETSEVPLDVTEDPAEVTDGDLDLDLLVAEAYRSPEADESPDTDEHEPEEDEVVEQQPVPLRKRNGGGSTKGKKVVGLKVGASQLAAAVVAGTGAEPALVGIARRPLEHGVVVDGELRDPVALAHALKSFFKDHGLPSKNVRLGLSSSRVGVRTFEISGVEDESRFDNAVRFKAHEVLPVAAHESVLDYRVVEERYTESGEISRRVLLVVAPRDQVEPYIEACRTAGLRLAGVDLEAFGLLRAFVPPFGTRSRTEDSATVVVAIGHEASTLLVAGGGICEFTRVFDWGGGALQAAIADELDVPPMEAATILTHLSLSGPGRHLDSLDADTRSRALEAVRTRLMPFARELVSSLQFYQTQPESLGIREILITGGTSHLEGLADSLHQMIGVSVSVGDPLGRVDVQTEIPAGIDATIGSLAVPIGLAIEDEAGRSVNLLPKESRQTRKRPSALVLAAPVAAAVPVLALAFMFVQANGASGDRQAELDAVRAEIQALPEPTRANIDPALAGEQAARATAVAQILGGRLTWERVLGDISRVLPEGVSLTELAALAPQPSTPVIPPSTGEETSTSTPETPAPAPAAVPSTPTGVTVTGYAFEYATIARALARIQAVPSLSNAQLLSATPEQIGQKRVVKFTIAADLALPGGAQ